MLDRIRISPINVSDLTATSQVIINKEWVFITCFFLFSAISFLRVHFGRGLVLISQAVFTQRHANQFLRQTNTLNVSAYLLPIFVVVFAFMTSHPAWQESSNWSLSLFFKVVLVLTLFLTIKYVVIRWIGHLFQQVYLFEEILFYYFLFEKVAGLFLFPILVLSIYSPFNPLAVLKIGLGALFLLLLFKWIRFVYLAFFKRSFSKTHLFVYLCTLEILPLVALIKHFLS